MKAARVRGPVSEGASELSSLGLFTVLIGAALPLLDYYIVNVALPSIGSDLHSSPAVLELVVSGYGLAHAVLLVFGGRLGDLYGRRRLFLIGLLAFSVTSLLCGAAPNGWFLVAARVAQGAAASLLLPQVLATIHASTSGARRGRAIGFYGATTGLAMIAGQVLGGVLVELDIAGVGWRSIFFINVPVTAVAWFLARRSLPETNVDRPDRIDLPGTVMLALALVSVLVPLTEGRTAGWPVWSIVLLVASPLLLAAFFLVERRTEQAGRMPLIPLSLLRLSSVRLGLAGVPLFSMGFGGFMFVVVIALQQGARFGPAAAGLVLVPMASAFFVASLLGPRIVARFGTRAVTLGAALQILGLLTLALSSARWWTELTMLDLMPGMVLAGFGQGLIMPALFRVVLSELPSSHSGVGSGIMITAQQSMLALGVAVLGSLFLALSPAIGMRDGMVTVLIVQSLMSAGLVALSLRLPKVLT